MNYIILLRSYNILYLLIKNILEVILSFDKIDFDNLI